MFLVVETKWNELNLLDLEREVNLLNENKGPVEYEDSDMSIEEFKEKYDLIDIRDLKGKYGF